ncbi:transporter substrate-binding domain-containing protein [Marinobacter sp. CHS3-4]|uniref:transporter substrate-binding domain-containing protein n=1 Tax=Marinobacter sp. CHS3-4 TaxID=3045174 RepID=UPI0024B5EE1E|nr:transporter substrate-binding domain-containing protein [Marinobacter sp. CHS3-4]MDI9243661.1 transporter substrate-binding domain-containing protein [Marinobacter sp. CHS3-4]
MITVLKRPLALSIYLAFICTQPAFASSHGELIASPLKVGVYDFPPIAMVRKKHQAKGLLGDLLGELEKTHEGLDFQVVHTSPMRRQLDFRTGLFDVMFFEHPTWSWGSEAIEISYPILRDDEVYVALNKDDRDQSFFDNIRKRRIVAIAGYHYGFAGWETDSEKLRKNFDIELSHSHIRNLYLIEADRPSVAEVAVVSRSFLNQYLDEHPNKQNLFLVSDKVDQSYELNVITRHSGPVDVQQIERLLKPLIESGRYQEMVRQHGLQLPTGMVRSP